MDTLDPLDTSFLRFTRGSPNATLHLGAVAILEGPMPETRTIMQAVEERLDLAPRLHQRLRDVPFDLGLPVWIDDTGFSLASHVHQVALPRPGSEDELRQLTGSVLSQQMDLTKPLWELWLVEGLTDGRWSVIFKFHHALADGLASVALVTSLMDPAPGARTTEPRRREPAPSPSAPALLRRALCDTGARQVRWLRAIAGAAPRRRYIVQQAGSIASGLRSLAPRVIPGGGGPLTGSVGRTRQVAWVRTRLDDVDRIRAAFGGAANDVALAAVTGGLRQWFLARSEPVAHRVLRAMVPVAVRPLGRAQADTESGRSANTVSTMVPELPVGLADPVDVLTSIQSEMARCKRSRQASTVAALFATMDLTPPPLLSLSSRLFGRLSPYAGFVHTLVTTVPTSRRPLQLSGCQVVEMYPCPPLTAPFRLSTAILSYDRSLTFAFVSDSDHIPDVDVVAEGTAATLAALLTRADDLT